MKMGPLIALFFLGALSADVLTYPQAPQEECGEYHHGIYVEDPYRPLEDPNAEETKRWVKEEHSLTLREIRSLPYRDAIRDQILTLSNLEKRGPFQIRGEKLFFAKNTGLQNQTAFYREEDGNERLLFDPNEGDALCQFWKVSKEGEWIAFCLSEKGSDWLQIRVLDVETRTLLEDTISWAKFGIPVWDEEGFYYIGYEPPSTTDLTYIEKSECQKVCYHKIGTPQTEDLIIHVGEANHVFNLYLHEENLVIERFYGAGEGKNTILMKKKGGPVEVFLDREEGYYSFEGGDDNSFWFITDHNAPLMKLIAIDAQGEEREIIGEGEDTLKEIVLSGDTIVAHYLSNASSMLKCFTKEGKYQETIPLPGIGQIDQIHVNDNAIFYIYTSFTQPHAVYRYNRKEKTTDTLFSPGRFDQYETTQLWCQSKDGTKVPFCISYKKGAPLENRPCYLYAYGGFGVSLLPYFSPEAFFWMDQGGIFAVANIRGGGEYGKEWHEAGTVLQKQNVFDDFIAVAEELIDKGITSSQKLAIIGASNGGLLVGACLTQRPELFAAAIPAMGVLDMLRFHKFTIGWAWITEYGSPEIEEEFINLYRYSPLHNIRNTSYPPTLILTADHDDRVVPAHSLKFAATLQEKAVGGPILLYIREGAGHGFGRKTQSIEESADKFAFLIHHLGMSY